MTAELLAPYDRVRALRFDERGFWLLDQRALPQRSEWLAMADADAVVEAIRALIVRGAPAIGIAAAYALVLAARRLTASGAQARVDGYAAVAARLRAARPTAVNLMWAVDRMLDRCGSDPQPDRALAEARAIEAEDLAANYRMALAGAAFIEPGSGVLTHCNTGSLATAGLGTALGVIRAAWAQGKLAQVHASETRPWLQGARLTAYELLEDGIPARLIADGAGAWLLAQRGTHWVIVGADRICANGDAANKIGTLSLAVAAKQFGARVMVVAPTSTVDFGTASGADIHIEERDPRELCEYAGLRVAAPGVRAWNPVFDVTPAELIDVIVTEKGVVERPDGRRMRTLLAARSGPDVS
ncbi:MAG: S-methyl-5-thioribose-1-phosphate isomerase [Xanthomonadales bacterium]|nr:Methylthioribose-1-phosphate isomerase [Xanthomonadales bacterium]MCC6593335.1 S-methyl-5-thioribose-1-phosphate isomerase [Xanthomonadales bacterium]MCE7930428.1 S-methyl-5-thioribose-1-phosphate isomerase [Xanthomonadales bacterium PRO6]